MYLAQHHRRVQIAALACEERTSTPPLEKNEKHTGIIKNSYSFIFKKGTKSPQIHRRATVLLIKKSLPFRPRFSYLRDLWISERRRFMLSHS